ncbi:MAG: nucleotide sugar dehydrogenase [Deltaproteobacteria bacterium]|nr:nucleotide sugar dehydrogenase [Deltaproteobacteria bacterium]MBI4373685.1 nucleotide sugar dehydrogenase [Deltaproteobacteria bacterium]
MQEPINNHHLSEKIDNRSARAGVIGLGYVGLPLAVQIATAGYETIGFDVSQAKVEAINAGQSYIHDVSARDLTKSVREKRLRATSDFSHLATRDFISICVPTPLGKGKNPDMSYIITAISEVKKQLRRGQVIILESTTYPGTTDEVALPLLAETGLKVGEDFNLAFSPERIDPGNVRHNLKNTPKIIGGVTRNCTEIAQSFYQAFIDRVIPMSSSRAAEMVKILENTFRAINIGLANEIAIMCNRLDIDTWEVIEAASTKPFGFMPFYPGPGLGGHCIPVDPHYLLWKLKLMDYTARFIQLADEINSSMPGLVVDKVVRILNQHRKAVNGSKVLVLGVAYKKDIDDCRESPALDVILLLQSRGAHVDYHDPFVPELKIDGIDLASVALDQRLKEYDCVVLITDHSSLNMKKIVDEAQAIVDTRNATKGIIGYSHKILKI